MPRGQILIHTQNFTASGTLAFVAQSVRRWAVETAAGLDIFPSLENPYGTALLFLFQLLIVFSSKSETDSPSQENQQLKRTKQNTVDEL